MGIFSWNKKKKKSDSGSQKPNQEEQLDQFTQQMNDSANACIAHFSDRYGKGLDFSEQSLELIDQILEDASEFYPEMQEDQKKWIVNSVGSYVFEVARRNYGGKYFWFDQRNQPIFVTGQPEFEISIVVFDKVEGRLVNGKEDNIPYFFQGYAERVKKAKPGDRATIV